MKILTYIYSFLFFFRLNLIAGFKALELLFPVYLIPFLYAKTFRKPEGWQILATFLVFITIHSLVFTIKESDIEIVAQMMRYIFSAISSIILVTLALRLNIRARRLCTFFAAVSVGIMVLTVVAMFYPSAPVLENFVNISEKWGPNRATGIDENPNFYSVYLLLIGAIALSFLLNDNKGIYIPVLLLVVASIAVTFSRGPAVAFVAQVILALFLTKRFSGKTFLLILSGILGGIIVLEQLAYLDIILARFQLAGTFSVEGNVRLQIWLGILEILRDNLIFGVGLKYLPDALAAIGAPVATAHNEYLSMLGSIGVFGAILFFLFHFYIMNKARILYNREADPVFLAVFLFMASMSVLFLVNTASTSRSYWVGIALFWLAAAGIGRRSEPQAAGDDGTAPDDTGKIAHA